MLAQQNFRPLGCAECVKGVDLGFDFTMAFQPIVNIATGETFAHEALARGVNNEPAGEVFKQVNVSNQYRFDQVCRVKAVKLASELAMPTLLSINFMPNAVYRPELCIRTTLDAAERYGFPIERIIFEFTEAEAVVDIAHLRSIVEHYRMQGFKTAIDDFGAGFAGLNLLAEIQTDLLKLDMALLRDIDKDKRRQTIVKHAVNMCRDLGVEVIAEGVETYEELSLLRDFGVELLQGYYLARPAFQALATVPAGLIDPT
jgi:EAL domain-containing protein (putative c-di-GMP-specific phosphodiesterase class I)